MAGTVTEDCGMSLRSSASEGTMSEQQRRLYGDSIAERRSGEQVDNGTASTSPPYWHSDDDDDRASYRPGTGPLTGPFLFPRTKTHAGDSILHRTYSFSRARRSLVHFFYRFYSFHLPPWLIHLCYFLSLAFLGSLLLLFLKPSNAPRSAGYLDMLFMSTSAATVSGLYTVAMEDLSSSQVVVLLLLMFLGGEVFVSLLALLFQTRGKSNASDAEFQAIDASESSLHRIGPGGPAEAKDLEPSCVRLLGYVVSAYVAVFHVFGTSLLLAYFAGVSRVRDILKTKSMHVFLFCLFTTVSSFANCGLIMTNENMVIFNKDPVVLLLMIAQNLAGNTLFPLFLRWAIWGLKKVTRREEFSHMLENSEDKDDDGAGLFPLLPERRTAALSLTVVGLLAALVALFCAMDSEGEVFAGLTAVQKFVNALFIAVNSRHAGETSVDCSLISPAVLVLLIVMMYLPSSMSFTFDHEDDSKREKKNSLFQRLLFSQLSCIVVFVIAVCITEREKMSSDPLNFGALNIIFEVISGYGNVGLSTGYSCSRLQKLHPEATCEDRPYSLSGWWSDEGKLILVLVMFYGRLKKFSAGCGKAWKLY